MVNTRLPFSWYLILLILTTVTSCSTFLPDITESPPVESPPVEPTHTPFPTEIPNPFPIASITFRVTIPETTPPEQPIQLSLLDEVTGLAINPKRYAMQAEAERTFVVTIDAPIGAILKYRYTRRGDITAEEHISDGRPVRYRLYRVDGPGIVNDIITRWNDTDYQGPTGRIVGQVTNSETNEPIPNLLITSGGAQTLTAWDGSYIIEGLPPGTHNLIAYAMDGQFQSFQQGALVAEDAITPASFGIPPAPLVEVTFNVRVPEDTIPAVPVRLAGNLYQFGNTYANLAGGISVPASRIPTLNYQVDNLYSITLSLPAGTFLSYKYTLGDGFWNAERTLSGDFPLRELTIPQGDLIINDVVETWSSVDRGAVWFDVTVPENTPEDDFISIQFNPFGWTEPIPMWRLEENRWIYLLSSPLDVLGNVGYRYCRNSQCGSADDSSTPGFGGTNRLFVTSAEFQTIVEEVAEWRWLTSNSPEMETLSVQIPSRDESFLAGIEFQPAYHPSWTPTMQAAFQKVKKLGANWVILTPTWTFTQINPLVFEPLTGIDAPWIDMELNIAQAQATGLNVVLFPTPQFPNSTVDTTGKNLSDIWWTNTPRDFLWWETWFENYQTFLLHHAKLASSTGVRTLILGGDWLNPALPNGFMPDGFSSDVPGDAEERWRALISKIRQEFGGEIAWALPYPIGTQNPPPFLDEIDQIYLLWAAPLSDQSDASQADIDSVAAGLVDNFILPFYLQNEKPLIIALAYPSADGGITGCLTITSEECLDWKALSRPNPNFDEISRDLDEQKDAYRAILKAVNGRPWINGIVSRGYYPPAALADKSISIHGKPAEEELGFWFSQWSRAER